MKFKELREKYRSKYPSALVSAAVKIAIDMSGNMSGAYKKIEAMKKGLANDSMVKDALRQANESVNEGTQHIQLKARIIDKEGSDKLQQLIQIRIVMKRLGIKEGTEIQEGTWQTPKNKAELKKLIEPCFKTSIRY